MFDDNDGVPKVAELLECTNQPLIVALVKSDRRLIENIQRTHKPRTDLRRQTDALRLAARQRSGRAVEREIVQPDVQHERQPAIDLFENRAGDFSFARVPRGVVQKG